MLLFLHRQVVLDFQSPMICQILELAQYYMHRLHLLFLYCIFDFAYIPLFELMFPMAELNKILAANEEYSKDFKHENLPIPPSRKIAVLACMDARLTVEDVLGLNTGDAHIIRNAGGIATDDVIRSLIISHENFLVHKSFSL